MPSREELDGILDADGGWEIADFLEQGANYLVELRGLH
jgi:hypothetical protein